MGATGSRLRVLWLLSSRLGSLARIGDSRAEILVSGAMINGSGFKIRG